MSAKLLYKLLCTNLLVILFCFTSKAQLTADFNTTSPKSGCASLPVQFQDLSTGPVAIVTRTWTLDVSNDPTNTTPVTNPQKIYPVAGLYTVRLKVTDAAGNSAEETKTNYIEVFGKPIVNFSANPTSGCIPLGVQFTDNSNPVSGTITSWVWDHGFPGTPQGANPFVTYTAAGGFNVILTVTNSKGCSNFLSKPAYINTILKPAADFNSSSPVGCASPQTITFQNNTQGVNTYQWDFNYNGTTFVPDAQTSANPSHSFTTGIYMVAHVVTNSIGCRDTIKKTITIGSLLVGFTAPTTICVGTSFTVNNTTSPITATHLWDFGDGQGPYPNQSQQTPTYTYLTPGPYTIKLKSTLGACQDEKTQPINVIAKPDAGFSGSPLTACKPPLTVNFTANTQGASSYEWHFGDGGTDNVANPSHTYTTYGSFTDTLIVTNTNGCRDTVIKPGYVKIVKPVVSFNNLPDMGCAPFSHNFSANISTNDAVDYKWYSNGVLFSAAATPTQVFTPGTYTIKLVITTAGGCKDSVELIEGIRAGVKPNAAFIATPLETCAHFPVSFINQSTGAQDYWFWDFSNGTSSSENPTHEFTDTGKFTITLIVGSNGCYDTTKKIDYIHILPPIAKFGFDTSCSNHFLRNFKDSSIGADTHAWNFGDPNSLALNTSTLVDPFHIFTAPGTYNVSLTVRNNITGPSCDFTKTRTLIISDEKALFTSPTQEICKNNTITFTATSQWPLLNHIVKYEWDFGDVGSPTNTSTIGPVVSHTYNTIGSKNIKLTITDINGCIDVLTKPAYIKVYGPTTDFVAPVRNSCINTSLVFNDLTIGDGVNAINLWEWTFGDAGNTIIPFTASPFTHAYANAGAYTVKLKVRDNFGCLDSTTKNTYISITAPVADFKAVDTVSCTGKQIAFTNLSNSSIAATYAWDFGDPDPTNNTSTLPNPFHIYNTEGLFTVKLKVIDANGCDSTKTKTAYIKIGNPIADFRVNNLAGVCPPVEGQFTNTSTNGISYSWTFGDGPGNPPTAGTAFVGLNATHTYPSPNTYNVTLVATSAGGCTSTKVIPIVVQGPSGTFTYTPKTGCSPLLVNFTLNNIISNTTTLDYGNGTQLSSNLSHTYFVQLQNGQLVGTYTPIMVLKDALGCTVTVVGDEPIIVKGVIPNFTQDIYTLCGKGNVQFNTTYLTNDPVTNFDWDFGDRVTGPPIIPAGTSTDQNPLYFYPRTGTYFPKVKVTTQLGCTITKTATVPTRVVKIPDIVTDQPANKCEPATYTFVAANLVNPDTSNITWKWTFFKDGSLVNTANGLNPTPAAFSAGTYIDTLIAVNSSGCKDTASNTFTVYPKPVVNAGVDTFSCKNVGVQLNATGADIYLWSPATGLSGIFSPPQPIATPLVKTKYTVEGTSINGCKATDDVEVDVINPFNQLATPNANVCLGKTITLTASGGVSYEWSPSTGLSSTTGNQVTVKPDTSITYTVIGTGIKGCFTDTSTIKLTVYPIPVVNAGPDRVINVGETITLNPILSTDITRIYWTPLTGVVNSANYPSLDVKPNINTTYRIDVFNDGGCTAYDLVNIKLLCNDGNIFMPNTFSPNADGNNDIFYPRGKGLYKIKALRIYDRWGVEVFARYQFLANEVSKGWDGTYKGKLLQPDVYVYVLDVLCDNEESTIFKGNVALIQ
jgi:gliding motility-associated-like protein